MASGWRACLVGALIGLGLAGGAPAARAEIWVVLDNPNRMGGAPDVYELFDRVCNVELPSVTVRGQSSASFSICGGLGEPGSVRIRYAGEHEWIDVPRLHGWSVIEAPLRPMGARPLTPAGSDEDSDE
ncbi:MAG TPA: hypothetical protein VMB81_23280 [Candidatus Sulfotelmatobacter sp.]|nr:hypothetical protein [Candidatus Sulfotelmatobacter sp.]